jgi:hypothetical protein
MVAGVAALAARWRGTPPRRAIRVAPLPTAQLRPGGGPPPTYRGLHQAEVARLLARVQGWRTAHDAGGDAGLPPRVRTGPACARDLYVAAAVQYAWAAESDYRLGNRRAARMADDAAGALKHAAAFCVSAPAGTATGCLTAGLWSCPAASPDAPQPGSRRPDPTPFMKSEP